MHRGFDPCSAASYIQFTFHEIPYTCFRINIVLPRNLQNIEIGTVDGLGLSFVFLYGERLGAAEFEAYLRYI